MNPGPIWEHYMPMSAHYAGKEAPSSSSRGSAGPSKKAAGVQAY